MPWSAKAQELLRSSTPPWVRRRKLACRKRIRIVGTIAAEERGGPDCSSEFAQRLEAANLYVEPIAATAGRFIGRRSEARSVSSAGHGRRFTSKRSCLAHGDARQMCQAGDGLLLATPYGRWISPTRPAWKRQRWWEELTGRGGEGMVVKPLDFIAQGRRGLAQPAIKCRGREYLRIIYGPE